MQKGGAEETDSLLQPRYRSVLLETGPVLHTCTSLASCCSCFHCGLQSFSPFCSAHTVSLGWVCGARQSHFPSWAGDKAGNFLLAADSREDVTHLAADVAPFTPHVRGW